MTTNTTTYTDLAEDFLSRNGSQLSPESVASIRARAAEDDATPAAVLAERAFANIPFASDDDEDY